MVDSAPTDQKELLNEQLQRIYVVEDPAKSLVRGCTTNPPLSLTAVKNDPEFWNEWIDDMIITNPGLSLQEYFWFTYEGSNSPWRRDDDADLGSFWGSVWVHLRTAGPKTIDRC
jgi:hypothetical protein